MLSLEQRRFLFDVLFLYKALNGYINIDLSTYVQFFSDSDRYPLRGKDECTPKKNYATILDKTVEKIVYLDSIFRNIVAVPVLPSPPSPESNVVVYSKESLIPGRLWEATLNWGKGFSFRKGVVLEIVLLRRKVDMMGKTFSSSFVRDCRTNTFKFSFFQ